MTIRDIVETAIDLIKNPTDESVDAKMLSLQGEDPQEEKFNYIYHDWLDEQKKEGELFEDRFDLLAKKYLK